MNLRDRAKKGLHIWKSIHGLKPYLNDVSVDHIRSLLLSPEETGILSSLLFDMRNSVEDFDMLVNYDKKKTVLLSKEDSLQNRWNFLRSSTTRLLGQTNIQSCNDLNSYVEQKIGITTATISHLDLFEWNWSR